MVRIKEVTAWPYPNHAYEYEGGRFYAYQKQQGGPWRTFSRGLWVSLTGRKFLVTAYEKGGRWIDFDPPQPFKRSP